MIWKRWERERERERCRKKNETKRERENECERVKEWVQYILRTNRENENAKENEKK